MLLTQVQSIDSFADLHIESHYLKNDSPGPGKTKEKNTTSAQYLRVSGDKRVQEWALAPMKSVDFVSPNTSTFAQTSPKTEQ